MKRWGIMLAMVTLALFLTACNQPNSGPTEPVTETTGTETEQPVTDAEEATEGKTETEAPATETPATETLSEFDRYLLMHGFDAATQEKLRDLKAKKDEIEAPYKQAAEAENALLRVLTEQDQAIWDRFWDNATEAEYTVRPFEDMVENVSFLSDSEKRQVLSSHQKRAAINERISAIYYDMFEATMEVDLEWDRIWSTAERGEMDMSYMPQEEYTSDDSWLYQQEALSTKDREKYLEIAARRDKLYQELDPILLEFNKLTEERQDEFTVLDEEYTKIYEKTDSIWQKIYAHEITDDWQWPTYSETDKDAYYRAFTMITKEEQDLLIQTDQKAAEISEKMETLRQEIQDSRPELRDKQNELMEKSSQLLEELSDILMRVYFETPYEEDPAVG